MGSLITLALLSLAWFRWNRFLRSAKYVGIRLGLLVLLLVGLGNGVTWGAVSRYREFGADVPDLRLEDVLVGPGDRFAFVHAYRGDPDADAESAEYEKHGTPHVPWRVDLDTGDWAACGGPREEWTPDHGFGGVAYQLPRALLFIDDRDGDSESGTWFDARTGERLGRGDKSSRPAGAIDRVREVHRSETGVRDSRGRRAWLLDGHLEKDGLDPLQLQERVGKLVEIPGGWAEHGISWRGRRGGMMIPTASAVLRTVDADFGLIRTYPRPGQTRQTALVVGWWDPRHALLEVTEAAPYAGRSFWIADLTRIPLARLRLLDLDTGTTAPLAKDPPERLGAAIPLARIGPHAMLLFEKPARLLRWTVGSREADDVPWDGPVSEGVELVTPLGEGNGAPPLASVGEPVLLQAFRSEPRGHAAEAHMGHLSGLPMGTSLPVWEAWLVYDPTRNVVRTLRPWKPTFEGDEPVRLRPDGSVLALEAYRRIVRLGPEAGRREVLFPRR